MALEWIGNRQSTIPAVAKLPDGSSYVIFKAIGDNNERGYGLRYYYENGHCEPLADFSTYIRCISLAEKHHNDKPDKPVLIPIGDRIRNIVHDLNRSELEAIVIEIAEDALSDTDAEAQDVDEILENHGIPTAARES